MLVLQIYIKKLCWAGQKVGLGQATCKRKNCSPWALPLTKHQMSLKVIKIKDGEGHGVNDTKYNIADVWKESVELAPIMLKTRILSDAVSSS